MIKRIIIAAALVVSSVLGFATVAAADNCPSNATCGASMPTVPVVSNPLSSATTSTSTTSSTQVIPTTTTQQSSTTGTPTINVPTVPVTAGTVQIPTIEVPTVKVPSAVTDNNGSTAQQAPVIQVPPMSWGNGGTPNGTPEAVDPSPVYPKVVTPEKSGSTSRSNNTPSGNSGGEVVSVDPTYVFPEIPTDNGGLPFGSILLVGVGVLAAVSYRAAKERGTVLLGNRAANRQQASS
jgi:hypothetical protein